MPLEKPVIDCNKVLYSKNSNLKVRGISVAVVHLVLVCWGLAETILELFYEQEPVEPNQIIYIATHFLFQVFLICTLIIGTFKNIPVLFLPWLSTTFIVFILGTIYTVFELTVERYFLNSLLNIITIAFFWLSWFMVYTLYRKIKLERTGYQYAKLATIEKVVAAI